MDLKQVLRFVGTEKIVPGSLSPWDRTKAAIKEIVAHTVIVAFILLQIFLIETLMNTLWGEGKLLFGYIAFSWIFDAADLLTLFAFLLYGIICSFNTYRRGE